jgi:putative two-component system hydrogenase maturation factor HypX/HoxX
MLALGADRVLLRDKTVLNPHCGSMGLYGSEYWTYVLPRRVSHDGAQRLTEECLPIGAGDAARIGLADEVIAGTDDEFYEAVPGYATALATCASYGRLLAAKRAGRAQDEERRSLECHRSHELGEMDATSSATVEALLLHGGPS